MNSRFIVIEYDVLNNKELTSSEKILYGYILALSHNKDGFCYATTKKLAKYINTSERQVMRYLKDLNKFNYISTTVINNNRRIITPTIYEYIKERDKENYERIKANKIDLFDYNWLEDEEE